MGGERKEAWSGIRKRISANAASEDGEEADSSPNHLKNVSKQVGIAFNVQYFY